MYWVKKISLAADKTREGDSDVFFSGNAEFLYSVARGVFPSLPPATILNDDERLREWSEGYWHFPITTTEVKDGKEIIIQTSSRRVVILINKAGEIEEISIDFTSEYGENRNGSRYAAHCVLSSFRADARILYEVSVAIVDKNNSETITNGVEALKNLGEVEEPEYISPSFALSRRQEWETEVHSSLLYFTDNAEATASVIVEQAKVKIAHEDALAFAKKVMGEKYGSIGGLQVSFRYC